MSWGGPGPRRTAARNASATLDADMAVCRLIMWGYLVTLSCVHGGFHGQDSCSRSHEIVGVVQTTGWWGRRGTTSTRQMSYANLGGPQAGQVAARVQGELQGRAGRAGSVVGAATPAVRPALRTISAPKPQKQCSLVKVVHVQEPCPELSEAREVPIQRVPFTSHCPSSCWCWASWVQPRAA